MSSYITRYIIYICIKHFEKRVLERYLTLRLCFIYNFIVIWLDTRKHIGAFFYRLIS